METIVMIAQILLSLSILVGVHEMGHLLAAKYFGMRVEQFSIGFPPKLFKFNYKDTEYAISAVPLGGYVKISGMIDESLDTEKMKEPPKEYEFRAKPAWQRLIVMLGGIFVNVIVGILIFIGITYFLGDIQISKDVVNKNGGIQASALAQQIGLQTGDQIVKINGEEYVDFADVMNPKFFLEDGASYTVIRDGREVNIPIPADFLENFNQKDVDFVNFRFPTVIDTVMEGFARKYDIHKGDRIISIEGTPVTYLDEFRSVLNQRTVDSVSLVVERNGREVMISGPLAVGSNMGFGVRSDLIEEVQIKKDYGFGQSVSIGTQRAFGIVFLQIKAFKKMFSGDLNVRKSLSGPIGIAQAYGGTWDWPRFWRMTGLLSMVLAFMNLLPIPALDGGHVMFLTAEMVAGRKPSDKFLEYAQRAGMLILLSLIVFIFANDILKLFGI